MFILAEVPGEHPGTGTTGLVCSDFLVPSRQPKSCCTKPVGGAVLVEKVPFSPSKEVKNS